MDTVDDNGCQRENSDDINMIFNGEKGAVFLGEAP